MGNAIYTKGGDKGETSLVGGTRTPKHSSQIHVYGDIDELNSFLGLAISHLQLAGPANELAKIQHLLFNLGSQMACEVEKRQSFQLPGISVEHVKKLENWIDHYDKELKTLKNFILPGGHLASSSLHICRCVCRRVERQLSSLSAELRPENSLEFLNRLSDYFFMVARFVNHQNSIDDILWDKDNSL